MSEQQRIQTYAEFFPYYLREHAQPMCRGLHYAGTTFALVAWAQFILTMDPIWILVGIVMGYAFAWVGHFFVEKNRPATFQYPWWSLISDFRMYGLWVTGRLEPELVKAFESAAD